MASVSFNAKNNNDQINSNLFNRIGQSANKIINTVKSIFNHIAYAATQRFLNRFIADYIPHLRSNPYIDHAILRSQSTEDNKQKHDFGYDKNYINGYPPYAWESKLHLRQKIHQFTTQHLSPSCSLL